ncbi:hypothetical protein FGO68_gene5530 [Halteria grandinella]|uniref:Uncharacterized protein n=1 Tax=Halteria grandinella TaxID=5974 RepID=A0A8J8NXD7_HALGN|nr:hypothetical protein FGO68_gene5530 [Halteria grandinella]
MKGRYSNFTHGDNNHYGMIMQRNPDAVAADGGYTQRSAFLSSRRKFLLSDAEQVQNQRRHVFQKESNLITPKLLMNTKIQFRYDPEQVLNLQGQANSSIKTIEISKSVEKNNFLRKVDLPFEEIPLVKKSVHHPYFNLNTHRIVR